jgi:hypothetical protein
MRQLNKQVKQCHINLDACYLLEISREKQERQTVMDNIAQNGNAVEF